MQYFVLVSLIILSACVRNTAIPTEESSAFISSSFTSPFPSSSSLATIGEKTYREEGYGFAFEYPENWEKTDAEDAWVQFEPVASFSDAKAKLLFWRDHVSIAHGLHGMDKECASKIISFGGQRTTMSTYCGKSEWGTGEKSEPEFRMHTVSIGNDRGEYGFELILDDSSVYHYEQEVWSKVISSFRFTE